MDFINSYSVSANYKKLPIATFSVPIQKPHQLLESIFHYERTEAERHVIQRLLCILDQKSDEKYRQLIEKLHQGEVEQRVVSKKGHTNAVHHKPLSSSHASVVVTASTPSTGGTAAQPTSDPYYNATKQQWAHNLLQGIKKVVDKIVTAATSDSPDKTALVKIQTEVDRLVTAGTNLTDADFTSLYTLPSQIFTTVQRAVIFTGQEKTSYINELASCYGETAQLTQVFADGRVEGFQDVLNVVKSMLTEEQFKIFLPIEQELADLKATVHTYDEARLERIAKAGDDLSATISASALPRNDKIKLTAHMSSLYEDQVAALKSFDVVLEATIFVNRHQDSIFNMISSLTASLIGVFAPIDLGKISSEISSAAIAGALQTVRAINSRYTDLTDGQRKMLDDAIKSLQSFQGEKYIAAVWAYFVASTVLANKPTATIQEVNAAVTAAAKEMENSKFALAANIKSTMDTIVSANGTFNLNGASNENYTIYSQASGATKVTINAQLLNRGNVGFLPKITEAANKQAESTARAYFQYKGLALVESAQLQNKIETTQKQLKQFQAMGTDLYSDQLMSQAVGLKAMALPSAVASVLIDRYMPKEVGFLNDIYAQLYYSNLGSSVGNAMIDSVDQYVNAATYFTFASYVGQQPAVGQNTKDEFPGTEASARAKLETERQQAALYLQSTQQAIIILEEQVKKVTDDDKITNEQRTRILDTLNNYRDNLNSISGSLVLLQNYLAPLKVTKGGVAGTFKVTGGEEQWQARLEILEDALVSGLPGNVIGGGMFPMQALIQSDQQSYADMGQNYQLELQMHLTSMQQEWTVVATSLQMLNQMYLSLARSLTG
ncbi:CT620/CT621 family type III secretion system effector [Chlamydia vaughanii]|uniref:CT620/CT621 family type III secretion system effector n=1 Tax=Chlamydia vaughanii TaxID=3112552 RepID=UPI0032B2E0D0